MYNDFEGEDTKMFKYYIYYALGRFRRQYFMQLPENESEYQTSRKWFVVEGAAASSIGILIGGAFLASLLQALEISDTLNGIITSLASVVCMAQFFGVYWAKRMKKIKLFVCLFAMTHRLIFTSLYFIPFLPIDVSLKVPLFIGMYLMAHILGQIIGPSAGNWIASLNEGNRGSYFARRDIVMVSTSVMTSLIAGQVFDYWDTKGETSIGFLIVGSIMLILTIVNFIALSMVKEPKVSYLSRNNLEMHGKLVKKRAEQELKQVPNESFKEILIRVYQNKKFRKIIVLTLIWQSAFFLSTPYFGIYQISNLKLSYTFIMVMGFIGSVMRVLLTPISGKIADRGSWAVVLKIALSVMALAFIVNGWTMPSNSYIMFGIFSILSGIGWAGIGPGMFSIQIEYAPSENRTDFLGVNAAIMGVCGFLSSLVGGSILNWVETHGNKIMGIQIYGQQILSFLTGIILLGLAIYVHCIVDKENRKETTEVEVAL